MNKQKLLAQLEVDEGLKLYPYKCTADRWTIGVGHNFQDNPFSIDEIIFIGIKSRTFDAILEELTKKGITHGDALWLLERDVDKAYAQLKKALPWIESKPDAVQRILVNMGFMGVAKLLKFKNTLEFIRLDKYEEAAKEMLDSLWAKQVKDRAVRLSNIMRAQANTSK